MKTIKLIFATFILSVVLNFAAVNADVYSLGFNEISIPGNGSSMFVSEAKTKTRANSPQYFYTVTTKKPSQGSTFTPITGIGASEWKNSVEGADVTFSVDKTLLPVSYTFRLRAKNFNLFSFKYWGLWMFDPA